MLGESRSHEPLDIKEGELGIILGMLGGFLDNLGAARQGWQRARNPHTT